MKHVMTHEEAYHNGITILIPNISVSFELNKI